MSTHKAFDRVCVAVLIVSLLLTALFVNGSAFGLESASRSMGYETRIFDTSRVHTLSIVMDDWEGFLETCENEEYAACSVVIDDESYKNVGLRAKGNTSLTRVSSLDSSRYSLKIEFDHYENGKTYHGLDKLCLNNIIQDNTYIKDYLTYRMMDEFGADAPLCSYVWITVNGEDWGLYLAVEGVEDSFLQRNYGADYGELYKPDSQSFGGGGPGRGRDFRMSEFMNRLNGGADADSAPFPDGAFPDGTPSPDAFPDGTPSPGAFPNDAPFFGNADDGFSFPDNADNAQAPNFGGMRGGGGGPGGMRGMGSDDVKLKYVDDAFDSYDNIFNNAKTDVTDADKTRLIASLKSLGEMENPESVVEIDEVSRYFVVHNYVVNGDSYTGSMIHNYYLYEKDGRLSMIPWDYNLAFGGFQGGSASGSVNDPIDAPLSVSGDGDRPMADWLVQGDAYAELYHAYFREFLDSVDPIAIIDAAYPLIAPYVERDPTKFCTDAEFEKGVAALRTFCELRTQSVRGQLDGSIPSTDDGQSADSSALIDASSLTLSDMGNMNQGGGFGGRGGRSQRNANAAPDNNAAAGHGADTDAARPAADSGAVSDGANATASDKANASDNAPSDGMNFPALPDNAGGNFPDFRNFDGAQTGGPSSLNRISTQTWAALGVSVAVLFAGLLTARLFGGVRRRRT